ncbi:RagB/SusD family nutrient uptake outer membrane protein [Flavobacterium sp.]|uniref:RagB/SusD family nutrient uptake outer membrane protein n=1 Tax=Flavobacterium sp. TaxID=239 RepID=UPI003C3C0D83
MKKIILIYAIIIIVLGGFTSCDTNDFLSENNPNIIPKSEFWKDLSDTSQGLNAVYQTMHKPGLINVIPEILRSDMGYPGYGRPNANNTEDFYLHTYNSSSSEIASMWQTNYIGIFRANQVIEALNRIKPTLKDSDQAEWTSQMAQARFFRGLFHYYLYSAFNNGSIIIRDAVPELLSEVYMPLSSASEVLTFVRNDLKFAYENLKKKGQYVPNDLSRVTSGAAATILGTTYLQELKYAEAMPYFNDVIKNHGYALEYDRTKLFTTAGEFNQESILEINFKNVRPDLQPWDGDSGTNWLNQQTSNTKGPVAPAWMVYAYKTEPMDTKDERNYYTDFQGRKTLRNVPLRVSSMMAIVEDYQTIYYLTAPTTEFTRFHGTAWGFGWWKKYTNDDIVANEGDIFGGATYSSKNVTLNRLADVYLMQAECKIKTGSITGVDGALYYINEIRKRWGLKLLGPSNGDTQHDYVDVNANNLPYTDANVLMQHLMRVEKPLEMSIEGHMIRTLDFQRWKKSDNYGFKNRLEELSKEIYYAPTTYNYIDNEGKPKTKNNNPYLVSVKPANNFITVDYEYDTSYLNYNESKHGQYPIPSVEVTSNPYINN